MLIPTDIAHSAADLVEVLRRHRMTVATAESCTGGLVASAITSVPGSSDIFGSGYITYSNDAKSRMLGVSLAILEAHGAVSAEAACAMAQGAARASDARLAVAVTGIAGPGGGSELKPIGLVFIAVAMDARITSIARHDFGDIGRERVRLGSVREAIEILRENANWLAS